MNQTKGTESVIAALSALHASTRFDLWAECTEQIAARNVLEVGVWKGEFAEAILRRCTGIDRYYMLDPWRSLENWNKPANTDQASFDLIYKEAMARTDFAASKRVVLRGTTIEMIDKIADQALDFVYIDGDHTLRGITIDLIRTYPKLRPGGVIGGDDYTPTIWQHPANFEPTLVCPLAAYFAESKMAPILVLAHDQFAIIKPAEPGNHFRVIETVPGYGPRSLLWQIAKPDTL